MQSLHRDAQQPPTQVLNGNAFGHPGLAFAGAAGGAFVGNPGPFYMAPYNSTEERWPRAAPGAAVMGAAFGSACAGAGNNNETDMNGHEVTAVRNSGAASEPLCVQGSGFGGGNAGADVEAAGLKAISSNRSAVESIEAGCVAHSIVLGIALGMQTKMDTAVVLLIVFLIHQALEAVCLSHLIATLESRMEKMLMVGLTTCSMPFGIIVGIAVLESGNAAGAKKDMNATTGGFSCVARNAAVFIPRGHTCLRCEAAHRAAKSTRAGLDGRRLLPWCGSYVGPGCGRNGDCRP